MANSHHCAHFHQHSSFGFISLFMAVKLIGECGTEASSKNKNKNRATPADNVPVQTQLATMGHFRNVFALFAVLIFACSFASGENFRPIIGILDQPTHGKMAQYGSSYIAASYVKVCLSFSCRLFSSSCLSGTFCGLF
jgi:hypothetical protein